MAKKYYFIGIGGISMSALAIFLKLSGEDVSGSDIAFGDTLLELDKFGITYHIGHKKENIENFNPDFVVVNCAIHEDNEEFKFATNKKIKVITRAKLLGLFSKKFKNVIAISGTHGKTTTVGMISEIFIEAKMKPTVHIGGILNKIGSNFLIGDNKFFITEACEYQNSFLSLRPKIGVMLNLERDHMDFFKNYKDLEISFDKFLSYSKIKIYPKNLKKEYKFEYQTPKEIVEIYAKDIVKTPKGLSFKYYEDDKYIGTFEIPSFGAHNINNAIVAIKVARHFKIKTLYIKRALRTFSGVRRRYEQLGIINNCDIIHDYAHHPTEIKKVIHEAKENGKVLTIFQPHTYSRTKKLINEFLKCFDETDDLFLYKTYPAREEEKNGYSAKKLYELLLEKKDCKYFDDDTKLIKAVKKTLCNYDTVLFLGAGNIDLIAKKIIK